MKIIVVNGSPRPRGATGKVLLEMADHLARKEDVQISIRNLSELPMQFCRGCLACYKTGTCVIREDGLENLSKEIRSADAVIFGSPTYGSNVTGQFKVFIDRGHFVFPQLLRGEYGFSVSTFENANGKKAIAILNQLIVLSGGILGGSICLKLDHNSDVFQKPETADFIKKKAEKFYQMILKNKTDSLFVMLFRKIAFDFFIKPRVKKHQERYAGVVNVWKQAGIHY